MRQQVGVCVRARAGANVHCMRAHALTLLVGVFLRVGWHSVSTLWRRRPASTLALDLRRFRRVQVGTRTRADLRCACACLPALLLRSVRMSGFDDHLKRKWLCEAWRMPGPKGNDIDKSNVPNVRLAFRYETLLLELQDHLFEHLKMD